MSPSRVDCCLYLRRSPHILLSDDTVESSEESDEDYDYDEEAANTTDESDEEEADIEAEDEESIDEEELEGLEEDLKMPPGSAAKKKGKLSPKKAAVEELTKLAEGMAISPPNTTPKWWSASYQVPYVIYAFKDQNLPVEHLRVDLFAPTVPDEYIRKVEVMPCGTILKVEIGVPRWFFEKAYLERCMGGDYHEQHVAVDNFESNVVQPVRSKFKENNNWIEGVPIFINLPKKCHVGDATWERGYFETAGRPNPDNDHIQYNWLIFVSLKTTKIYEVRNAVVAAGNFAVGGAM